MKSQDKQALICYLPGPRMFQWRTYNSIVNPLVWIDPAYEIKFEAWQNFERQKMK